MISARELVDAIEVLDAAALQRWIDLGWIIPDRESQDFRFDQSDVARVHLICELHYDLCIEEDSMSVVLSLMDQLYATRRTLAALVSAVAAQPEDVQASITALVAGKV